MSYQFNPFKDNWLSHGDLFSKYSASVEYTMSLDDAFFQGLRFDSSSLLRYRIDAAKASAEQLGNKPVLCLSGGIDSQAMIQCWLEADIKFEIAIGAFNNNLNEQDVTHAKMFCNKLGLNPIIIDIDVLNFLTRENHEFGEKYRCTSPHFNTHYKMFDILRGMSFTGICLGGTAFARSKESWGPAPTPAQMNYVEYAKLNQFPIIGNFLGYDPKLCWSIALLTPPHSAEWYNTVSASNSQLLNDTALRYEAKILGYRNHGFDIIPQDQKYTGFELVKEYFAEKFNDGWAFEKKFRHPLEKMFGNARGDLIITQQQTDLLDQLYKQYSLSS